MFCTYETVVLTKRLDDFCDMQFATCANRVGRTTH
jgi:hypothetical protein